MNVKASYIRLTGLILLLTGYHPIVHATKLDPGCITTTNQTVAFDNTPATFYATPASGGSCAGSYSYQWQVSTDNIYFTDIPGATSQNLSFSIPLTETSYFQRKTSCGSEIRYTTSAMVTMFVLNLYIQFVEENVVGSINNGIYSEYADVYFRFYDSTGQTTYNLTPIVINFSENRRYVNMDGSILVADTLVSVTSLIPAGRTYYDLSQHVMIRAYPVDGNGQQTDYSFEVDATVLPGMNYFVKPDEN